ncbi:hypothetical protein EJB05_36926 [Eragrostis curvula]|uniref:F-box domain-containing protein n=1 Tax=Eragrostis curvula TaxID=38414 RepID=A0A5J9U185_9POAL|nr:hypothetical protein EJB05_36926 [Eragrostis curvula]
MPQRRKGNEAVALPGAGASHIDVLPDGVLHHILGFVDAREAVRTCILARRWRHLWKSATALRLFRTNLSGVPNFMQHLLLLRGCSPFDTFHLCFLDFEGKDVPHVNLWVRHALLCKVQELILSSTYLDFPLDDLPLVSQNLRSLELNSVILENSLCDFSGCPSLEHVNITFSALPSVKKITSKSVKRLTIRRSTFNEHQGFRTRIYAPNLVSLTLDDGGYQGGELCRTPVLDIMPKLQEAFVRLSQNNADCCSHADESGNCGEVDCDSCCGIGHDNSCLWEGLSEADNLKLIAESKTFVFKRDLKQCPTFSKLKTLFLNDYWCGA